MYLCRSPNTNSVCVGTDLNRNWGYHWNDGGSSSNPCSDSYMGKSAFSEVENQNVRDFLSKHKDTIKYYVNLHSYSQLVLLPWGFTEDPMPVYDRYLEVAHEVHINFLYCEVRVSELKSLINHNLILRSRIAISENQSNQSLFRQIRNSSLPIIKYMK